MKQNDLLRQIQLLELDALKEIKDLCDKNGIRFYLRGGSVMGAAKYGGFVPWDDDADIVVPRDHYESLISIAEKDDWSDRFTIISYRFQPRIHCYFPRVLLREGLRKQLGLPRNNMLGLTIIDILPLDAVPDKFFSRLLFYMRAYSYRALSGVWTMGAEGTVNMHSGKHKAVLALMKASGIYKRYTQVGIYKKLEALYTKNDYKTARFIGSFTGSLYRKEIMPREVWGEGRMMRFETENYLVPDKYDEYLKRLYGKDYMSVTPSMEEINRKTHIKSDTPGGNG